MSVATDSDQRNIQIPDDAPGLLVWPDKFAKGWPRHAGVQGRFVTDARAALLDAHASDAHCVGYRLIEEDGKLHQWGWRLTLPGKGQTADPLEELAAGNLRAKMVYSFVDVDTAHKDGAFTRDEWAVVGPGHIRGLVADCGGSGGPLHGALLYTTDGGYRIVARLATPLDVRLYRCWARQWLDVLRDECEIEADRTSIEWSRMFRLPAVARTRDGKVVQTQPTYAGSLSGTLGWMPTGELVKELAPTRQRRKERNDRRKEQGLDELAPGEPDFDEAEPPLLYSVVGDRTEVRVRTEDGAYVPASRDTVLAELRRHHPDLLPTPGERPGAVSFQNLIGRFGRRLVHEVFDMRCTSPRFEPDGAGGGTLRLPAARLDPRLTAAYNEEVEHWLELVGGERAARLQDWLAASLRLDWPACALYLQGENGAGKSLLWMALARMWGGHVTLASAAGTGSGDYNDALCSSPLVVVDEGVSGSAGRCGSAVFRALLANSEHEIRKRWQKAPITLRGHIRMIVAANGHDALKLGREVLTREDEEAIGVRVLHVDVPTGPAKAFLESIGGRARGTREWIDADDGTPGLLCRHIMWLSQTRKVEPGTRFIVEGDAGDWLGRAARRDGRQSDVLTALALVASGETGYPAGIYGVPEGLLVNAISLFNAWRTIHGTRKQLGKREVANALMALSPEKESRKIKDFTGRERRYWLIPWASIVDAASHGGLADPDFILRTNGLEL